MAWASYQIRKIAGCACAGNAGNVFPRRRFQRKPIVSDPGMHHGTCVTHVPWCMSGSLTRGGGENVRGIPGACAPAILRIWQEAHMAVENTSMILAVIRGRGWLWIKRRQVVFRWCKRYSNTDIFHYIYAEIHKNRNSSTTFHISILSLTSHDKKQARVKCWMELFIYCICITWRNRTLPG